MRGVLIAGFDPAARYRLDHQVALRDEPFGALAYHYGSRRLVFLRSRPLVGIVRDLAGHTSAAAAVDAAVPPGRREGHLRALASLVRSGMLVEAP